MDTKIFCGLDTDDKEKAWEIYQKISPINPYFKIGYQLFYSAGPEFVRKLTEDGAKVFLDLKMHDIPNTVASGMRAVAQLGISWVNVHISGGEQMLLAAREALNNASKDSPKLLGVTVLTSMDEAQLSSINIQSSMEDQVLNLAKKAKAWGADGIVCSAKELTKICEEIGDDFVTVVPGIRLAGSDSQDQKRVATPKQAAQDGAHFLVVARAVINAEDSAAAMKAHLDDL